ncbi:hypothetical protein JCM5350_006957 [Sporobolomyces pararoseus]
MAYTRPYPAPPQAYAGSAGPPAQPIAPSVSVPPGTLPPGTIVNVGDYQVVVDRFLSGFAHVYLATSAIPLPIGSPRATTKHVLKRMAVPDKRGVHEVGKEVEVMRQLKNHPKIVNMIEASVADLPGGVDGSKGYEIYILMEWCAGGGIIDMMNTRLQNRMTESEILKIFADTVEAVAHMHYQSPPLIHRDLKVENILLTPPQTYKLCDFGSTTKPLPRDKVPTAVEGIQKIELEINKTTTLQYRAPELVDVWGRKGYDEKIDIWALGVLLYKLCYYTTPFEENGPLAILNAQYKFLPYPAYSPQIRSLISSMLQERPENRPNIYQVHEMTCRLRGVPVRIENKYAMQPSSTGSLRPQQSTPTTMSRPSSVQPPAVAPPTANILSHQGSASSPNLTQLAGMQDLASQVSPMRRGRPGKNGANGVGGSKDGWAAFASPGKEASTSNVVGGGFGDSFSPGAGAVPNQSKSPEVPLETEVELPKNMGMFRDLVSPKSDSGEKQKMEQEQKEKDADEERKRFESTFPALLDDDLAPFGPSSTTPAQPSPQPGIQDSTTTSKPSVASPQPLGLDLTGEGPPLPRRPLNSSSPAPPDSKSTQTPNEEPATSLSAGNAARPRFVERASQTSPHLLASWKNGSTSSSSPSASTTPASQPPTTTTTTTTTMVNGKSGLRQSSIPEFDLSSPGAENNSKPPTFDLLGDDDNDHALDSYSPGTVPLPKSPLPHQLDQPKSPALPPKPSFETEKSFASKRMSFMSSTPPPQRAEEKEREKFRPIRKSTFGLNGVEGQKTEEKEKEKAVEEQERIEERFPALSDSGTPQKGSNHAGNEFEEVVERDGDGPDSSDDETPTPVPAVKVDKPAFSDDEDFAPRSLSQKAATASSRPTFGAKLSSQTSLSSATTRLSLADSPTPLEAKNGSSESQPAALPKPSRSTTMSSVSSSEGGGDIDLGPALASIRKFAPSGNNNAQHSILDEQDEDDFPPPAGPSATALPPLSKSTSHPTSTLPPLTSPVPAISTPLVPSSTAPTTGFVPIRPSSAQPPPLLAPKPRKPGALNSLVSRYEGLGTTLTGGPPPVGSKPVGLRKDSTGSNASLGRDTVNPRPLPSRGTSGTSTNGTAASSWKVTSPEPMNDRFSEGQNLAQQVESSSFSSSTPRVVSPKPSTPTQPTVRAPFKPVPPTSSPQIQSSRSRYSMAGPPAPASAPSNPNSASTQDQEEEEKFAGVRNMRSRWESMSKPKDESDRGGVGSGNNRKSWTQI